MSLLVNVCVYAVVSAIIISIIRSIKPEFTIAIAIAAGVGLVIVCVDGVQTIISSAYDLQSVINSKYVSLLLKIGGICCICRLCADICVDCGVVTLASRVISICKISICALCIPLLGDVIQIVKKLCEM